MGLRLLSLDHVTEALALAVDAGLGASREQVIAANVRRAASLLCPTTPSDLVGSVIRVLRPVYEDGDALESDVAETLDALVGCGDLVEAIDAADGIRRRVLFLGSPRYVRRRSGGVVLLGVRPDASPLVGNALAAEIEHSGYLRRVRGTAEVNGMLADYGLQEIQPERWLRPPEPASADEFVRVYNDRLNAQPPSGEIPDLRILDPNRPVAFYRGRWRPVDAEDSGHFVGRRSQGYGADLWCYVQIRTGEPRRLIDLPATGRDRGCDEAWRLQAAIDCQRGEPQQILVGGTGKGTVTFGLQAPPPRWLQRRWDLLGLPRRAKALFAYDFAIADVREELAFAIELLWLERTITPKDDQA